jgi:hypothetical protein
MLRLTRHLFAWTAGARYADYTERALLNGILGTQNADGMMMYYVPIGAGFYKVFSTPDRSFWCCVGTGVEGFARIGDDIYYHNDTSLYVNQFIASELGWKEKGVRVVQQTRFPEEEGTELVVHAQQPVSLAVWVRIPYWAVQSVHAKLNGESVDAAAAPGYLVVERTWRDGDQLNVSLPMSLHVQAMPDDPTLQAFMYGPVVLLGLLGDAAPQSPALGQDVALPAASDAPVPVFVITADNLAAWVKPVAGHPLTFIAAAGDARVTLKPFYQVFDQRYGVYWRVLREGSPEHRTYVAQQAAEKTLDARTIDRVVPSDAQSESAHHQQGQNTGTGPYSERHYRHAVDGGWFSWDLKVLPDQPMVLRCTYWGSDSGARTFDVVVDEKVVATQSLTPVKPGQFYDVEYPLPEERTHGKHSVTVRFQAHPGNFAGGVFDLRMVKPTT